MMSRKNRQALIALNKRVIATYPPASMEVATASIVLALLENDCFAVNKKLAHEITYRLVDAGAANPEVMDDCEKWVLNLLNSHPMAKVPQ